MHPDRRGRPTLSVSAISRANIEINSHYAVKRLGIAPASGMAVSGKLAHSHSLAMQAPQIDGANARGRSSERISKQGDIWWHEVAYGLPLFCTINYRHKKRPGATELPAAPGLFNSPAKTAHSLSQCTAPPAQHNSQGQRLTHPEPGASGHSPAAAGEPVQPADRGGLAGNPGHPCLGGCGKSALGIGLLRADLLHHPAAPWWCAPGDNGRPLGRLFSKRPALLAQAGKRHQGCNRPLNG